MQYLLKLRYVKLLSYISAFALQNVREESHKHRYVYYYGFQIIYGAINKILLLVAASLLLGTFTQTMVVTGSFVILRVYAGGLHFKSYTKCAYVSLITLLLGGLLAKYVSYHTILSILVFIFVMVTFLLYSPVENSNRPIQTNEKIKFKIIAIVLLSVLFMIQYFIADQYKLAIIIGTLFAGLITMPLLSNIE